MQPKNMGSLPSTQPEANDLGVECSPLLRRKWCKKASHPRQVATLGSKKARAYQGKGAFHQDHESQGLHPPESLLNKALAELKCPRAQSQPCSLGTSCPVL